MEQVALHRLERSRSDGSPRRGGYLRAGAYIVFCQEFRREIRPGVLPGDFDGEA